MEFIILYIVIWVISKYYQVPFYQMSTLVAKHSNEKKKVLVRDVDSPHPIIINILTLKTSDYVASWSKYGQQVLWFVQIWSFGRLRAGAMKKAGSSVWCPTREGCCTWWIRQKRLSGLSSWFSFFMTAEGKMSFNPNIIKWYICLRKDKTKIRWSTCLKHFLVEIWKDSVV